MANKEIKTENGDAKRKEFFSKLSPAMEQFGEVVESISQEMGIASYMEDFHIELKEWLSKWCSMQPTIDEEYKNNTPYTQYY